MTIEPSLQPGKSELRKRLRLARASIGSAQRTAWDEAINHHLLELARREQPQVLAGFLGFDGEPHLAPALAQLEHDGLQIALPVVCKEPGRDIIEFRKWSPESTLSVNPYGIREPVGTLDVRLTEIDIVLLPLVGWDSRGGRLGMGASYYDRAFQALAEAAKPLRIGVAYRLQQVEQLPVDPWDVCMHGVLTESGLIDCRA